MITTCSFLCKQYNITYKLITLLIKRRNSLVKQSESIFQTNMRNVFCILWNLLCICVIWFITFYKLTHARKICERYFTAINKECFKETAILFRSSHQRCSIKMLFIKISQYSQESTYVPWSLFLTKFQDWSPAAIFKIDFNTGFSCEYCKILKSTYFEEHLRTATFPFFKSIL